MLNVMTLTHAMYCTFALIDFLHTLSSPSCPLREVSLNGSQCWVNVNANADKLFKKALPQIKHKDEQSDVCVSDTIYTLWKMTDVKRVNLTKIKICQTISQNNNLFLNNRSMVNSFKTPHSLLIYLLGT